MDVSLTVKNYRRFSEEQPARISIRRGLTAFIGANNSGKTSLLRLFYDFRQLFLGLSQFNSGLSSSLTTWTGFSYSNDIADPAEVFSLANDRNLTMEWHFSFDRNDPSSDLFPERLVVEIKRDTNLYMSRVFLKGHRELKPNDFIFDNDTHLHLRERSSGAVIADFSYIFEFFRSLSKTLYVGSFRNALNLESGNPYFDINVGTRFISEWREMKTGPMKRKNDKATEVTASIKRIFGLESLEINASNDGSTLQLTINGRSFKLGEIGSGIAQFIMVLSTAATREPHYIFIDEPELSLHPALQVDFLTTLASFATQGLFFATHSVGLARTAGDRIYSVAKESGWNSVIARFEGTLRLPELMGEMSFLGQRELGYRKILLVEGPTEVKTLAQFLRFYKKDHEIVQVSMNGTNLINGSQDTMWQLEELMRLSDHVYALIDSERRSQQENLNPERQAFLEACSKIGVRCHVLSRRAMEHYLTDAAIKRTFGNDWRALEAYEDRSGLTRNWSKHDNWRIAREMEKSDIEGTDLGIFLSGL